MLRLVATLALFASVLAVPILEDDLLDMQTHTRAAATCNLKGSDCLCNSITDLA
jgi:hypothetical protein